MSRNDTIVIDFFSDGKANLAVVPPLVRAICGRPRNMYPRENPIRFLQRSESGSGWTQKAAAARKLANHSDADGAVFVIDTEGDLQRREQLAAGRDLGPEEVPMVVGAAHPCIEAWLLVDATAIQRGLALDDVPQTPEEPESLPRSKRTAGQEAKRVLKECVKQRKPLSADAMGRIAAALNEHSLPLLRRRCPLGFAPFADEVEERIRPLFGAEDAADVP